MGRIIELFPWVFVTVDGVGVICDRATSNSIAKGEADPLRLLVSCANEGHEARYRDPVVWRIERQNDRGEWWHFPAGDPLVNFEDERQAKVVMGVYQAIDDARAVFRVVRTELRRAKEGNP